MVADLSFTFDFTDFFVEDNGFINGFVYSDLSSEYVGETLTSIDWDLSFESDAGGTMDAVMYIDGGFDGWFGLNNTAGVDALVVSNDGSARPLQAVGTLPALASSLMVPPRISWVPVSFTTPNLAAVGILNGTITFNMTPAPGRALLGMAGLGRRKRS